MASSQDSSYSQAPRDKATSSSQTLIPALPPYQTQYALRPRPASPPPEQPSLRTILDRARPNTGGLGGQLPGGRRLPVSRLANVENVEGEVRDSVDLGSAAEQVEGMAEQSVGEAVEDSNLAQTEEVVRQTAMDEEDDTVLTQDHQQGHQDRQSQQDDPAEEGIAEPVPDEYDMEDLVRDYPYEAIIGSADDSGAPNNSSVPAISGAPSHLPTPDEASQVADDDLGGNDLSMDLDSDAEYGFEGGDLLMDLDSEYGDDFDDDLNFDLEDDSEEHDEEEEEEDMDNTIRQIIREGGEVEMDYMDADDMLEDESLDGDEEENEVEEERDSVAAGVDLVASSSMENSTTE
ncbi:hypothetical protein GLAREA_11713 [Glarea lozoyensis ATCC 20868]|uniref:Uncharacterized protein n=2 Tax=Glarea lozoyensis TaxID=101852 RepID=S3CF54_GLAL2|nr:uncharacterized protein GLAREA_11713 [Glarea lozoyensis ATCC 20868]EHL01374.1 hypothetical protein M7I_2707 [Glarea lozoyensis 74030]EPE25132.1 hypothetical protein GLAREA_11713 [Glarea lozoyensis ATCC 20868]